jgi:hypothetical protein
MENALKRQFNSSKILWLPFMLTGAVLLVTLIAVILISRGVTDPPVAGPVIWSDRALAWASGPQVTLAAGEDHWWTAPAAATLPDSPITLDVQARLDADGDPSAAWGVWIERPDGARVIYALSGEGYVTTRVCAESLPLALEDCPALRPEWRWMPYPRVQPPGDSNTITLHQETSGDLRLRLNGEILGAAPVARSGAWGVWARGGRDRAAAITWQRATVGG